MKAFWAIWLTAAAALAQQDQNFSIVGQAAPPAAEQQELIAALNDANTSPIDIVRVIEAHLKKYPNSAQRDDLEKALAKASIDAKDDRRIILYGERALLKTPDDMLVLDRVARALLNQGGRDSAEKAFRYAHTFEDIVNKMPSPSGSKDAARRQEERDRGAARALLYQSRAKATLGEKEESQKLAARSFTLYPSEEGAREWSEALARLGRDTDAIEHLADAFAVPDAHTTDADRAADRVRLGELYSKLHGSEKGLGDLLLAAYDRTAALVEARRTRVLALDPNAAVTDPIAFTLTGLDGSKLPLAKLKGSVVVMDFWATWCKPCQTQHPMYEEVKQRFRGRSDVVFLAVDADEDHSVVSPFLDEQKWSRTSVYFEDGLSRLLEVSSIPTTILFDKQARVSSRMNGFVPDRFVDQLTQRILQALLESVDSPDK
jgi:thiol-disulfide isomerase/thioredoxin